MTVGSQARTQQALDLREPDLLPHCGLCGDINESGTRFCDGCGNPLTPEAAHARQSALTRLHMVKKSKRRLAIERADRDRKDGLA